MRLLTFTELQRQKGIPYCRDHLRRLVKAGQFPRPIELGARRIAWAEDEIRASRRARGKAKRCAGAGTRQQGGKAAAARQRRSRRARS